MTRPKQTSDRATTSKRSRRTTPCARPCAARRLKLSGAVLGPVAAFAGLTATVSTGVTAHIDRSTLDWFTWLDQSQPGHLLARIVVGGGQLWLVGPLVLCAASLQARRAGTLRPALVTTVAVAGLSAALAITKHLVGRTSPHSGLNAVLDQGSSYPSGHAAIATLCLPLLVTLSRGARLPASPSRRPRWVTAAPFAVGIATLTLGYHWPTDAVGGWLLGAAFLLPARHVLTFGPVDPRDHPVHQPKAT